jgi:hypothetical protein
MSRSKLGLAGEIIVKVELQTENGSAIEAAVIDRNGVVPKIIAAHLQHVDLYGDTTFNGSQLTVVSAEWSQLDEYFWGDDERSFLRDVAELIERGRSEVHTYLKFVGD